MGDDQSRALPHQHRRALSATFMRVNLGTAGHGPERRLEQKPPLAPRNLCPPLCVDLSRRKRPDRSAHSPDPAPAIEAPDRRCTERSLRRPIRRACLVEPTAPRGVGASNGGSGRGAELGRRWQRHGLASLPLAESSVHCRRCPFLETCPVEVDGAGSSHAPRAPSTRS